MDDEFFERDWKPSEWIHASEYHEVRRCALCGKFRSGGVLYRKAEYRYGEVKELSACWSCDPREPLEDWP